MKVLRKFFDWQYAMLKKTNTGWAKPMVDAGDGFFFGQPHVTARAPHIRDSLDIKRYMILVLFAVLPCAVMGVLNYGWRSVLVILTAYVAGGIAEMVFCVARKEEITEGFLITGILYPLTLPPTLPLWMVAVGVVFGVIFGKEVFGGSGKNIFNPALIGRAFVYICFPVAMTGAWSPVYEGTEALSKLEPKWMPPVASVTAEAAGASAEDSRTVATPILTFKQIVKDARKRFSDDTGQWSGETAAQKAESREKAAHQVDRQMREKLPSARELMLGKIPGSIGESSKLLILIGGLLLLVMRVASWRTVASCLAGAFAFSYFMHRCVGSVGMMPPDYALLTGGFLFGIFFMATDPISSPITRGGKYFYGFMIGVLAMLIRYYSGFPEGIMFAIILMNIFSPLIDIVSIKLKYRKATA